MFNGSENLQYKINNQKKKIQKLRGISEFLYGLDKTETKRKMFSLSACAFRARHAGNFSSVWAIGSIFCSAGSVVHFQRVPWVSVHLRSRQKKRLIVSYRIGPDHVLQHHGQRWQKWGNTGSHNNIVFLLFFRLATRMGSTGTQRWTLSPEPPSTYSDESLVSKTFASARTGPWKVVLSWW